MKTLLIVLAVFVAAVVVIVLIGAALPKHHNARRAVLVKIAPEHVFALISGPQDWRSDLKEYKFFEDDGRRMIRETDKHGQTITYAIVDSSAPTRLKREIADKNLPFRGSWTWIVQAEAGGSSVTIIEDGEVYNPVFRFVSRFVLGHTRSIDNYLAMLEQESTRAKLT